MANFKPFQPYRAVRSQHRIKVFNPTVLVQNLKPDVDTVENDPEILNRFADFGLEDILLDNIWSKGYMTPTPIQDKVIPVILSGKDVVGMANTGTGKTAAFWLPLINKVLKDKSQKVLVLAPTRELAVQIEEEFRQFAKGTYLQCVVCIGGVGLQAQIKGLTKNPNFVVGTPGRIKDLANQNSLRLSTFNNIVLDEVDRMLDMGFVHDVGNILTRLPADRQTAFFSATMPVGVERIMNRFLKSPQIIKVTKQTSINKIAQEIVKLNGRPKLQVLEEMLRRVEFEKVLVFGRSKFGLERLHKELYKLGFEVVAIHGNKSQAARQKSLELFKKNKVKVLLATDVASRGLDIDDISHVINYDLPESHEDYVHRIGRTGRMHKKGKAITLV